MTIYQFIKTSLKHCHSLKPYHEGAIMAQDVLFATSGPLGVIISVVGNFLGQDAISKQLKQQIADLMGTNTTDQIQKIVVTVNCLYS